MQKPTGRNQNSMRGMESRTPRDSGSASVSRDPPTTKQAKPTRKSSAEINRTVNALVQQANKLAVNGLPKSDLNEQKLENSARPKSNHPVGKITPKQIVEMQGGYFKSKTTAPVQAKTTSGGIGKGKTATVSFAKDAEPSGISWKSKLKPATDSPARKSSVQKTAHIRANSKEVRLKGFGPAINRADGDAGRPNQGARDNYSSDVTSGSWNRVSNRLDYYSTSSSDDECTRPPRGPNAPLSPASKAKMWNDINKSPGPTYPGWKFRSPPEGRHLSQIGAEELSAMFKNMKLEAQAKTEDAAPKGPSKFSDYMRKMKTGSRVEEMLEASLQQNNELKKTYAEQLEAMEKRAWDSLEALDANLKRTAGSGSRTSLDKFMEGTSRIPNRMTVGEMAKSMGGHFEGKADASKKPLKKSFARGDVVQADDFSSDESNMMSPPSPQRSGQPSPRGKLTNSKPSARMDQMLADIRKTRRQLAQGDGLPESDAKSNPDSDFKTGSLSPRPSGFGDSARSPQNPRTRTTPDDYRSLSRVTADQFKSLAEEDPLKKLKKISEQLKIDNARMLSRRAPNTQGIKFSSSEDDESDDFDVPCKY